MRLIIIVLCFFISSGSICQTLTHSGSIGSTKEEHNFPDEFILHNIIGTWKDQNSTTTFWKDSSYEIVFDKGQVQSGIWYLKNGRLIYKNNRLAEVTNGLISKDFIEEYNILSFTKDSMSIQGNATDKTIWIAVRVERSVIKKYGSIENEIEFVRKNILPEEVDSIAAAFTRIKYFDDIQKKYLWVKKIDSRYEFFINCNKSVKKKRKY